MTATFKSCIDPITVVGVVVLGVLLVSSASALLRAGVGVAALVVVLELAPVPPDAPET